MSDDLSTQAAKSSNSTFLTALVFNAFVFGVEIAIFTLIRPRFKAIYEPRTYVPSPNKRVQPLSDSIFKWPLAVYNADYNDIIKANGMDAYFFVRFLRLMVKVFLPIWLISWAVLLPVTSVNTHVDPNMGINLFIFGNIAPNQESRYAAHIILVYFFTAWIFYNIRIEMKEYILARQKHLIDPVHAKSVQANTLLVTGIPAKYLSQEALMALFKDLPGGVKKIWINRDLKDLPDIYDRRLAACAKLESAETSLLSTAAKLHRASLKAAAKADSKSAPADPNTHTHTDTDKRSIHSSSNPDVERGTVSTSVVPRDKRPSHRLGWIPFTGEKVDTIEWAREEIRVCTELLDKGRAVIAQGGEAVAAPDIEDGEVASADTDEHVDKKGKEGKKEGKKAAKPTSYPALSSAFVTFNRQIAAHLAMQVLTHHEPYRMAGKYVEVSPDDVIWANLNLNPYEQKLRMLGSYSATAALILLWALPVAFVGIISNIAALCVKASWLAWLCDIPGPIYGIIAGILPPVLLAVLMMLLPIILRLFARFEGIPKRTGLELALMNRFFMFHVIHSFLIVTISSGIIASLPQLISNPTSIPTILATKLPQASIFFFTYIILQGLSGTAGGFLQVVPLAIYYVKLYLLGSTPRSVWGIKYGARNVAWGTLFPMITLLVVITLGYSIIAPIINGLACATFFAFYMMYKYLFLWQFQQPRTTDTGGLFFPKAIQHLFVGLYVQQVCLCALFFLAQNENHKPGAVAEGALMVVLIIITIFFQMLIRNSYGPLIHALPLTLADKTYTAPSDEEPVRGDAQITSVDADVDKGRSEHESEHDGLTRQENAPGGSAQPPVSSWDQYGFAHPAASRPQQVVWLPKDTLGLGEEEERACREAGVEASVRDAEMNGKGSVDITGPPPDYVEVE